MDPVTVLAGAKAAFEAIKVGVKVGKEIQSLAHDISSLMKATADLTKVSKAPPSSWTNKDSAEKQAIDAFMARKEAEELQLQVRNMIVGTYGLKAWDEILREIVRIRREQQRLAAQRAKERQELIEHILVGGSILVSFVVLGGVIFVIITVLSK